MNILEEYKIKIKYRDEMVLWENDLKRWINEKAARAFLSGRISITDYDEVLEATAPELEGWRRAKLRARVAKKQ